MRFAFNINPLTPYRIMTVTYDKKIAKILNSKKLIKKHFGEFSKNVVAKIRQIAEATSLKELLNLPGHVHELIHQAKGVFAVTLKHPFRLVFRFFAQTQTVEIIAIEDYHDNSKKIANYNK